MILRLALLVPLVCISSLAIGCSSDSDGDGSGGTGGSGGSGGTGGSGGSGGTGGSSGTGGSGGSDACTPLAPTGTAHQLVISEVVPGMGIEVFNSGTTAVDVDDIWFCSNFDYQNATAISGKTTVAPGSFVVMEWPDTETYQGVSGAGGEMLLYSGSEFPTMDSVQSYVCWGDHTGGRKGDSASGTDLLYTGDCTPALTSGSIKRKPSTDGLGPSSYDETSAPALADCPL